MAAKKHPSDETNQIFDITLAHIATRLRIENNLAIRAALGDVVDSLLDFKLAERKLLKEKQESESLIIYFVAL